MSQKNKFGASLYDNELVAINSTINILQYKTAALEYAAQQTIRRNGFFIYRVKKLNREYPFSWLLTLFIILLFLLPGYIIYTISSQHEYYQLKRDQERKMVMAAYSVFATNYKTMFNDQVSIFSRHEDPPFNTIRKQSPVPASMTDFLQKYLDND
jgi:hypothetical protein